MLLNGSGMIKANDGLNIKSPAIMIENNTLDVQKLLDDIIEKGVKEMQPLPAQDGNRDWGLYYRRKGHMTKPHTEYVKEVIEDPYNHRGRIEGVIRNTDKDEI